MSSKPSVHQRVNPFFQIIALSISLVLISIALYINLFTFYTRESYPPLKQVTQEKKIQWNTSPKTITTGLYIKQFQEFNIIKNKFTFIGIVWFLFDKGLIPLDKLKEFSFEQGEITALSPPHIKTVGDKEMVQYNVKVEFRSPLNYSHFPLDDHSIYLVLVHNAVEPKDIFFVSADKDFSIDAQIQTSGWRMVNHAVDAGYVSTKFDVKDDRKNRHYIAVVFSIDYARCARRYVVSILLPLLFLFFMGLFSFSVDNKASIALASAAITGTMGYRYVIEKLSPLSGQFMLSDHIFFVFLAATCIIFILNIIDVYGKPLNLKQKKGYIIALHGLIDVISIYLLVWWT